MINFLNRDATRKGVRDGFMRCRWRWFCVTCVLETPAWLDFQHTEFLLRCGAERLVRVSWEFPLDLLETRLETWLVHGSSLRCRVHVIAKVDFSRSAQHPCGVPSPSLIRTDNDSDSSDA